MTVGLVWLFVNLIVSFFSKTIFIGMLGIEFNGLNSLFSNILTVLNLAELGFAGSIAYALYKPIRDNDEREIAAIMNYFCKVYRIVAGVVLVLGLAVIPVLQYLINEDIANLPYELNEIRVYYTMFLLNTVFSYLLAYKRTIIRADQNAYIITTVDNACNIIFNIIQMVMLYLTHNYFLYLVIMISRTVIDNLIVHIIATKKYKYLSTYKKDRISQEDKKAILKNVRAMMLHNIGSVAIVGTTSIVISAFVGIVEAGKYGNYLMLATQVNGFLNIIFSSMTASIGNLCADRGIEEQYKIFKRVHYLGCMIGIFAFSCYTALFQPFITVWIGEENLLSMGAVLAMAFTYLVTYMRNAINNFKTAKGMFRQDRYKPLVEATVGVGLAIGLSYVWGVAGVIIGYTLATLFIAIPVETYVLFKQGFGKSVIKQLLYMLVVMAFAFSVGFANYCLVGLIRVPGIGGFVLKAIVSVLVSVALIVLFTARTAEFKYFWGVVVHICKAIAGKIKGLFGRLCKKKDLLDMTSEKTGEDMYIDITDQEMQHTAKEDNTQQNTAELEDKTLEDITSDSTILAGTTLDSDK